MDTLIRGLRTNKSFAISTFFVFLLLAIALLAPVISPHDPVKAVMRDAYFAPSADHILVQIN